MFLFIVIKKRNTINFEKILLLTLNEQEEKVIDKIIAAIAGCISLEAVQTIPVPASGMSFSGLEIRQSRRQVFQAGEEINLTRLEYSTLVFLASNSGIVLIFLIREVLLDKEYIPSMRVSLNPQFLQYDLVRDSGINVGYNEMEQTVGVGENKRYLWHAGQEYGACIIHGGNSARTHFPELFLCRTVSVSAISLI